MAFRNRYYIEEAQEKSKFPYWALGAVPATIAGGFALHHILGEGPPPEVQEQMSKLDDEAAMRHLQQQLQSGEMTQEQYNNALKARDILRGVGKKD